MERCPVELWLKFAEISCVDGGYTASSLSLVSRAMRIVVEPVRFHSVALCTLHGCDAITRVLKSIGTSSVIRLLFVAIDHDHNEDASEVLDRTTFILTAAAPTLHTLMIYGEPPLYAFKIPLKFAALRNISAPYMRSPPSASRQHQRRTRPMDAPVRHQFLCLHRIHINTEASHCLWDQLADCMPLVTHVRVSDILRSNTSADFLRILLDVPPYTPESTIEEKRALCIKSNMPNIAQVFIPRQALHDRSGRVSISAKSEYEDIVDGTRDRASGKLNLLSPSTDKHGRLLSGVSAMRAAWRDLVEGGNGPWRA